MADVTFVGMANASIKRANGTVEEIMLAIVQEECKQVSYMPEGTLLFNGDTFCISHVLIEEMVAA